MSSELLHSVFYNNPFPVVVCLAEPEQPVIYLNASAKILLDPMYLVEGAPLSQLLCLEQAELFELIAQELNTTGIVRDLRAVIKAEGPGVPVSIFANQACIGDRNYHIIYLRQEKHATSDVDTIMTLAFQSVSRTHNIKESIQKILALSGSALGASRAYVSELRSGKNALDRIYTWCDEGTLPVSRDLHLQLLRKLHLDKIALGDMYAVNDVDAMPLKAQELLKPYEIRALMIFPMHNADGFLGYIGLDDCTKSRTWNASEVQIMQNIASLVASMLTRREAERKSRRTASILQTTLDNIDQAIYVNKVDTFELVLINQTLADLMNLSKEDAIGKKCWQKLQHGTTGPCSFCPLSKMLDSEGNILRPHHTWEYQCALNGRRYAMSGTVIPWIDGQLVHIETALDITDQRIHEEQLRYIASIDTMTGVFNREWGYKLMQDMMSESRIYPQPVSIVFVDLDGLKHTNDNYGHDAGDDMINRVVLAMRSNLRKSDTICRWGGDEFLLLLRCDPRQAETLVERIQEELEQENRTGGRPYPLSFSYGIVDLTQDPSVPVDRLVSAADQRMYKQKMAKRAGKETG